jgi:hypothetical protein
MKKYIQIIIALLLTTTALFATFRDTLLKKICVLYTDQHIEQCTKIGTQCQGAQYYIHYYSTNGLPIGGLCQDAKYLWETCEQTNQWNIQYTYLMYACKYDAETKSCVSDKLIRELQNTVVCDCLK